MSAWPRNQLALNGLWPADLSDMRPARVLVADDDRPLCSLLQRLLGGEGLEVVAVEDGASVAAAVADRPTDLVILDVVMPGLDGFEACERLKSDPKTRLIPVVMITGLHAQADRVRGIEVGADDFLTKPFDPEELLARVRSLLRVKHFTDELERSEEVLFALGRAIEGRDSYTRGHCDRLSHLGSRLGERLGLTEDDVLALKHAGIVHDLGKVSIPDSILLKPGPLTEGERGIMQQHPVRGEAICRGLKSFERVLPIVRHHHERFDGSGYPDGLRGTAIPLTARILQVVDVFDALTTTRPYREAGTPEEALATLREEAHRGWWDPEVVLRFTEMIEAESPMGSSHDSV